MDFMTYKHKSRINSYYLRYFFIVLPFLFPVYFSEAGKLQIVLYAVTYLSLVLMAIELVRDWSRQISIFPFMILLCEYAVLIYSTYANGGLVGTTINTSIKKLLLFWTVGKTLTDENKRENLILATRDICIVIFLLNFVTEIVYPTGIPATTASVDAPHYLLGNVNSIIRSVFPGICCAFLISENENRRFSISLLIFYLGILYQFVFIYHSATTFVAMTLLLVWKLFAKIIRKHVKLIYGIVLAAVAYIQITLIMLSANNNLQTFLTTVFGKDVTFSGRVFVWERALTEIGKSPILGFGIRESKLLNSLIGNPYSAHNYFLDLLYQRGIVGLCLFLILVIVPFFFIRKGKPSSGNVYYLIGFNCAILLMFLFEPFYVAEACVLPIILSTFLVLYRDRKKERQMSYQLLYSESAC